MVKTGATPLSAPGWTGEADRETAIIDCDVHHNLTSDRDLLPYLPRVHREHLLDQGLLLPTAGFFNVPFRAVRTDLNDAEREDVYDLRDCCSEYDFLREQHLDLWNIDCAVLTGAPAMYSVCVLPDPDFAAALCRAMNDLTMEKWIARDDRVRATLLVSPSDPAQAAREVHRLGDHPQVVGIILPTGAPKPYGNRFYHPLWEACAEHGLAVLVHPGAIGAGTAAPPTAVGYPTYYMEERMARPSQASAHCASLICEGVFEKCPQLKFAFIEVQQSWLIGLMWHMDADWKMLRDQTPWVKRLPSEYIRGHIRVGSQPLHEPERPQQLLEMLEAMHADETLIYCSDFPHYDWDDPQSVHRRLPERLQKATFERNPRDLFGSKVARRTDAPA